MDPLRFSLFWKIVFPSLTLIGLAGSLAGIAVGVGLLVDSAATLGFLRAMNRWVSTRRALKPLEIPRPVQSLEAKDRRWLGFAVLLGGAIALVVLAAGYGDFRSLLRLNLLRMSAGAIATGIVLEAVYLFLLLGSVLAVVAGVLLLRYPRAWEAIEVRANRWVSARRLGAGASAMHFTLDSIVEARPRAAGWTIALASLAAAAAFGALFVARP